jgi:hypothetical protein
MTPVAYRRTRGGRTIHRAWCRHGTNGTPWHWAAGKTPQELDADGQRLQDAKRALDEHARSQP